MCPARWVTRDVACSWLVCAWSRFVAFVHKMSGVGIRNVTLTSSVRGFGRMVALSEKDAEFVVVFVTLSAWTHVHCGFGRFCCKKEIHAHLCCRNVIHAQSS